MIGPLMVINLDRTPQRFAQFQQWNPDFDIERVSAIDGLSLNRDEMVDRGLITPENVYSAGAIGSAMSHVGLWRRCAAGTTPFHIVEDDIILRRDLTITAEILLRQLLSWDIVIWTHNFDWPLRVRSAPGLGTMILQHDTYNAYQEVDMFRNSVSNINLFPLLSAAGTGCYSISPNGASRLLAMCLPISNVPAVYAPQPHRRRVRNSGLDIEMSRHYEELDAFVAIPSLAVAPNDQLSSTNRGRLADIHDVAIANNAIV